MAERRPPEPVPASRYAGEDSPAARWEDRTADEWRALWAVPAVHPFTRVGSTNDVARRLAEAGAEHGTVVLAEEQVAGRGRGGRGWVSAPAASLVLSIVIRPAVGPGGDAAVGILPLRVGLGVARAIDRLTDATAAIKWPNDVLLDGRKVAGILCEGALGGSSGGYVVAGIGVNVAQREEDWPPELRHGATSLRAATGAEVWRPDLAGAIIADVLAAVRHAGPRLDPDELAELRVRDALFGRPVRVDGSPAGTAFGIAEDGSLRVRRARGALDTVRSGTVRTVEHGERKAHP